MWRIFLIAALGCAGLSALPAAAQRVAVVAQTLSATQQAARLYGHSADLGTAGVLPGAEAFPGLRPRGPLAGWPDSPWALQGSETLLGDSTIALRLAPFTLRHDLRRDAPLGYRERLAGTTYLDGEAHAIFLGTPEAGTEGGGYGCLVPFDPALPGGFGPARLEWRVDGVPAAAVLIGEPPVFHMLYGSSSGPVLASGPLTADGPAELHPLEGVEAAAGLEAGGLAVSSDGPLWATVQGFSFARARGAPMSWLYALDPDSGQPLAPPIELSGIAAGASFLFPRPGGCSWIATEARGPGFIYVTRVCLDAGSLKKAVEYPMRLGTGGFHLAIHGQSGYVAAAAGNRLELWPGGVREDRARSFADSIHALLWDGDLLLVGEGNRIHQIDLKTLDSAAQVAVPSGQVARMLPVPRRWAGPDADGDGLDAAQEAARVLNPFDPDTDGDGLHDGRDPEPRVPSPRLELPDALVFRGDAAGSELRTVRIDPVHGERIGWRVYDDDNALPWLRVYPNASSGPGLLHLGVDPEIFDGSAQRGALRIALEGTGNEAHAAGSPHRLRIAVQPARGGVRRVLWVWPASGDDFRDASDPRGFAALAARLAAAPFYFSHVETGNAAQQRLSDYGLIVLSAEAAEQGVIAPGDLLDYVADGGAVLLPGTGTGDQTGGIARLLAPIEFGVAVDVPVAGTFQSASGSPIALPETGLRFAGGHLISAPAAYIVMPDEARPELGVAVARDYGLGRVAVLAAPTPLAGAALARAENQRFADALFRWLARAGTRITDDDGDGLSDTVEIAYGTDASNPDTDGDGVPDGMEDRNRNGIVDEGETDPRNLDSDGDGIFDGADPRPYPPLGAPRILAVSADEGPLEGGRELVLTGRNLPHDARFEVGGRSAPLLQMDGLSSARILVPEGEAPGPVSITVSASNGEGALANAYTYTARSVVTLVLEPHPNIPAVNRNQRHIGILRLRAEAAPDTVFNRIILRLRVNDAPGFTWSESRPSPELSRRGIDVKSRDRGAEGFEIVVNGAGTGNLFSGDLVWLPWEQRVSTWDGGPIRIELAVHPIENTPVVLVLGPRGGLLDGRMDPLDFMPNGAALPRPSLRRSTAPVKVNVAPSPGV